jgi:hypothetical protein
MSRAKALVEAVTFDALSSVISGATVYQDAPVNAPGDLVILGEMKSFRLSTKEAEGDRRVTIAIVTIVEAEERAPLLALQEEFEDDDAVLTEDGATYGGITSFNVLAFAPSDNQ